jgi:hypothetical protein
LFSAPFRGAYAFTLTADFHLYFYGSDAGYIEIYVSGQLAKRYLFDSSSDDNLWQAYSIDFAFNLNVGDQVWIVAAGDPVFDISRSSASWMGYLVLPFD